MKYAIFGGSFNPIHNGHIIIVQEMLDYLKQVDRLFIVPAGCSPFKKDMEDLAAFEYRFRWCEKAFDKIDKTQISDIEANYKPDFPSYTVDTLKKFFSVYSQYPALIIGEDSLSTFHRWKDYRKILETCELAVFRRRGYSGKVSVDKRYLNKITVFDSPYIEISSSTIRERIKAGKSIAGYVPDSLEREIVDYYIKASDKHEES